MTVRAAEAGDKVAVLELALRHAEQTGDILPDIRAISEHFDSMLGQENFKILVIEVNGGIAGAIALALQYNFLTSRISCTKLIWLVDERYRGHGVRLLKVAEKWASDNGAQEMIVGSMDKPTSDLMKKMKFKPTELLFRKEL